jgi:hypothetical protein
MITVHTMYALSTRNSVVRAADLEAIKCILPYSLRLDKLPAAQLSRQWKRSRPGTKFYRYPEFGDVGRIHVHTLQADAGHK